MDDILEFVRNQLVDTLEDEEVREETLKFLEQISPLPGWIERHLAALLYGTVKVAVKQIADGEPPSQDAEDVLKYVEEQLTKILDDDEVKENVIEEAADLLPLPNFIERRILGIIYNTVFRAIRNALGDA